MPEGDTIFRTARTLERALVGRTVAGFESVLPGLTRIDYDTPLTGREVTAVRAIGKHLLIDFSGGLTLHTHMRMSGQWHIYRPGERWRRHRSSMRIVLSTDAYVAVAFDVPVARFLRTADLARDPILARVGPDLLGDVVDEPAVAARLRAATAATVAEALLDQRVMAGIGNVFKSEALFASRIDPLRAPETLTEDEAMAVVRTARAQLRANVVSGAHPSMRRPQRRTSRAMDPSAALGVYGRGGRPCRVCGAPIAVCKQGEDARLTYWCPACQR